MSDPDYTRSQSLLTRADSRLVIVDVQERFIPVIPVADQLIANCRKLILGAQVLEVPVSATEQYPRGLGPTTPLLAELLPERPEKMRFSSAESLPWARDGGAMQRERFRVVLAGIETHVCILQTAFDLQSAGFEVILPADALASRRKQDWRFALQRMRDAGMTVTTTESILFEWCEVAGTEEFKQISRLVK